MKQTNLKNQKGITLVALAVTVIVIAILAGISIKALSGENGILNKAFYAKKVTTNSKIEENINSAVVSAVSIRKGKVKQNLLERELKRYLEDKGIEYVLAGDESKGWTITIPKEKLIYTVAIDGKIESKELIDNSGS